MTDPCTQHTAAETGHVAVLDACFLPTTLCLRHTPAPPLSPFQTTNHDVQPQERAVDPTQCHWQGCPAAGARRRHHSVPLVGLSSSRSAQSTPLSANHTACTAAAAATHFFLPYNDTANGAGIPWKTLFNLASTTHNSLLTHSSAACAAQHTCHQSHCPLSTSTPCIPAQPVTSRNALEPWSTIRRTQVATNGSQSTQPTHRMRTSAYYTQHERSTHARMVRRRTRDKLLGAYCR
jgi:hypothetical protein